jgi:hypothetical protein
LDGIEKDCVDMLNIKNLTISNAEKSLFSAMSLAVDEG